MIPIKINGKRHRIKPINQLTTEEFIEISKIENLDLIKYISWSAKVKLNDAFFAVTSKTIEKAIGNIPNIEKIPLPKWAKKIKHIESIGQRHQVESCGLTGYELLIFTLAVSEARSNNIDDVNKLYDHYLSMPFIEVLPAGFFFFNRYRNGRNFVRRYLFRLLSSIKTQSLKKMPVYKS